MTLDRRLARIDETLSPTPLVLRWLAEAHSLGDLVPYVNSLLVQDPPVAPLDRLAREAAHGAPCGASGPSWPMLRVRSALRETVFRYELVLRINVTTHELLDREELIAALFASQLAMLLSEGGGKRLPDGAGEGRRPGETRRKGESLADRGWMAQAQVRRGLPAGFGDVVTRRSVSVTMASAGTVAVAK